MIHFNLIPKNFDGNDPTNVITQRRLLFYKNCSILESQGFINPKKLTTFDYFTKVSFLEEKLKKESRKS